MRLYPVILSGGAGTRLWPMSREHYPKPLMPLLSERSLLQDTALRLDAVADQGEAVYVCNEEHRFLVAEQVSQLGKRPATVILEPEGRNTAPALTLAALFLLRHDPTALMIVMPADHVMTRPQAFIDAVQRGRAAAANGALVTFGILPDRPETGYGYIRRGDAGENSVFAVREFVEKPDQDKAQHYLDSGEYYWNSGIFLMRADRWLEEVERFAPAILQHCRDAMVNGRQDLDFFRASKADFLSCPADSIDYAVMEKSDSVVVIPMDAGWSDVGAWPALWEVSTRDSDGNVLRGDVLVEDTHNAFLLAQHRCLAAVGVEDIIVVETADAVLVASKEKAQQVKAIVARLKAASRDEHKFHRLVYRPWGSYEGIDSGPRFQVKRLTVKPGAQLSLQMHHHRAEHWVVVKGTARVTCGEQVFNLHENESTYIPMGEKHRLENPGNIPLEVIEIQSGSYLGEDDIIRFEDVYDRVRNK